MLGKILIVEDQTLLRDLLAQECGEALPLAEVVVAADCSAARAALRKGRLPDVILLDLVLPDGDGFDLVPEFFGTAPDVKIIVLSSHLDEFSIVRAGKARVHGIFDKNDQPALALREAIADVLAGRRHVSPSAQRMREALRANPVAFDKLLTDREQQVLRLVGEGLSNEQIAERLSVVPATIKSHRLRVMAKLDLHTTPQLIRYAIERGFSRIPDRRP